jgi:hypothetical protein
MHAQQLNHLMLLLLLHERALQFWNIPFWRCSVGICRDESVDDMGFIEKVVDDLPKRLPLKPNHVCMH